MWTRSTASRATARNTGPKATASGAEPALWVWTAEKDLESSLNSEGGRTSSFYFNSRDQTEPHQDWRSPVSGFKQPPPARLSSVLLSFFPKQTSPSPPYKQPQFLEVCPESRRRRRLSQMREDGVRGGEVSRSRKGGNGSLSATQQGCLCHRRSTSTSLLFPISPGIKAASAAESVAKASSPRPSLTETGRYSVKVCIQQDLKSLWKIFRNVSFTSYICLGNLCNCGTSKKKCNLLGKVDVPWDNRT